MEASQTAVYCGTAAFEDSHTVRVRGSAEGIPQNLLMRGEYILIAIGSVPFRPESFSFDHPEIYDSDTILDLDRLPGRMAVIGAGVIGSEYACTFAALGAEVHVVDGRDVLLPFLDKELSVALQAALVRNGIVFHWKERPQSYTQEPSGAIKVTLEAGNWITVDAVLVAS